MQSYHKIFDMNRNNFSGTKNNPESVSLVAANTQQFLCNLKQSAVFKHNQQIHQIFKKYIKTE